MGMVQVTKSPRIAAFGQQDLEPVGTADRRGGRRGSTRRAPAGWPTARPPELTHGAAVHKARAQSLPGPSGGRWFGRARSTRAGGPRPGGIPRALNNAAVAAFIAAASDGKEIVDACAKKAVAELTRE
jgi:hypothetical protein